MRWIILLVPAVLLAGCVLSAEERKAIVDQAAEIAGIKAADVAFDRAMKAGLTTEEATAVAAIARVEGEKVARAIAERAIPAAEAEKRSKTGAVIVGILMTLLQAGVGMVKPKGVPA